MIRFTAAGDVTVLDVMLGEGGLLQGGNAVRIGGDVLPRRHHRRTLKLQLR